MYSEAEIAIINGCSKFMVTWRDCWAECAHEQRGVFDSAFIMNWPYVTYIESTEMYPYDYEIKLQCLIGRDKTLTRFGWMVIKLLLAHKVKNYECYHVMSI